MRYRYVLKINGDIKRGEVYTFAYGNTKNISLKCIRNKGGIVVTVGRSYMDDFRNDAISYLDNLLREGIKRIQLIHILKFKADFKIKQVILEEYRGNDFCDSIDITKTMTMFSMLANHTHSPDISENYRSFDFIQKFLSFKKADYSWEISALYSYIFSKYQDFAIERFMYLWMALNGFYKKKYRKPDCGSLSELVREYGFGNEISNRDLRNNIGGKIKLFLYSLKRDEIEQLRDNNSDISKALMSEIDKMRGRTLDITALGFVMFDFAYYLRCTLFHGEKPIPLFCFDRDVDLKSLYVVNKFLDEFLDEHLVELFK